MAAQGAQTVLPTSLVVWSAGHGTQDVMELAPSVVYTFSAALNCPAGQGTQLFGVCATSQKLPLEQPFACEHEFAAGVGLGVGEAVGDAVGVDVGTGVGLGVGLGVGCGVGLGVGVPVTVRTIAAAGSILSAAAMLVALMRARSM
jgi:hypothetical protein